MKEKFDPSAPLAVGGQAVMEGVMMRAPGMIATAVRRADGEIIIKKEPFVSFGERNKLFKLPILRGAVGLIEMMVVGIRTLNYSAEIAMEDQNGNGTPAKKPKSRLDSFKLGATVVVSLLLGVGIFFVSPLYLTTVLFDVEQHPVQFNLIAGVIRVALLVGYVAAISLMKDIQRIFQYHGAEHKAVFAYELGFPLDVKSVAMQSRFHPRCGTSFLLVVMFVAILSFSLLDAFLVSWLGTLDVFTRLATHLPLVPLVGGISYEFIKYSAKKSSSAFGRIAVAPGLWLQKITTQEPDELQIEVAIAALRNALGLQLESESLETPIEYESLSVG